MNDLERQVEAARDLLEVPVTRADSAQALLRLQATRRRRTRRRAVAGGVGAVALAAGVLAVVWPRTAPPPRSRIVALPEAPPSPTAAPEAPAAPPRFTTDDASPTRTVVFTDGSLARLLEPDTELRLEAETEALLEVALVEGRARFTVERNPARVFRVRTEQLRIEVLGTRFTVEERPDRAEVRVSRGRVAVLRDEERHELGPGMRLVFDGERTVIDSDEDEPPAPKKARRKKRRHRRRARPSPPARTAPGPRPVRAWRDLAQEGRYGDAYVVLNEPKAAPPSDAASLMLAADVARLSGHPAEAARYLRRVVREHRSAPQGMLAAFTLGRLLQRELGQPREAAEAYHVARSLAPSGSLAEDALAHEAECRARAGQTEAAAVLAKQYLRQYPSGRKVATMRRLVGPEP